MEEQNRQVLELKSALSAHISDIEIGELVNGIMNHYFKLFCMKSDAAKVDVFYVITGMWKTTAEGFFLWIGGFRPSELLKVMPTLINLCWLSYFCYCIMCILMRISGFGPFD